MRISASHIATLGRCARERHLYYNERLRSFAPKSEPLIMGSLFHAHLEAWNLALVPMPSTAVEDAIKEHGPSDLSRLTAQALADGYSEHWMRKTDNAFEVLDVEREFVLEVAQFEDGEPIEVHGYIDAVYQRRSTGGLHVVEHKTKSGRVDDPNYWRAKKVDHQIDIYYWAAEVLYGKVPAGVIYDVVAKPSSRPQKATPEDKRRYKCGKRCKGKCAGHSDGALYADQREHDESAEEYAARVAADIRERPHEYYKRETLVRLDAERARFVEDIVDIAREIRIRDRLNLHTKNSNGCFAFGLECGFFPICSGEASPDNKLLFRRKPQTQEVEQ